jgi:hypothetical protein
MVLGKQITKLLLKDSYPHALQFALESAYNNDGTSSTP